MYGWTLFQVAHYYQRCWRTDTLWLKVYVSCRSRYSRVKPRRSLTTPVLRTADLLYLVSTGSYFRDEIALTGTLRRAVETLHTYLICAYIWRSAIAEFGNPLAWAVTTRSVVLHLDGLILRLTDAWMGDVESTM